MASTLSNLLPPPEGKRRTAPIAIDYLRCPSRFDNWKGPLALGAALLTIAAVVLVSLPAGGQRIHSRGPLAQVHAALNNDCQSCHVDFVPISGTAAGLAIDSWAHVSDANCQACHTGHIHHDNQLLDAARGVQSANCASCHVEHRGQEANLLHVADRYCTVCHSDLTAHRTGPSQFTEPLADAVDSFSAGSHPTFRSIREDPGRLEFNHTLHMTAGLTPAGKGVRPYTTADLPERHRDRYAAENANGQSLVKLDCGDCHELGSVGASTADAPSAMRLARASGDYFRPVVFERHCQACHPLPYRAGFQHETEAQVPHRTTAEQLERSVRNLIIAEVVGQQRDQQETDPQAPVPGNELPTVLPDTAAQLVEEQLERSARHINSTCQKCHTATFPENSGDEQNLFLTVEPVKVPAVWFQHARFNHGPHLTYGCKSCHTRAYADADVQNPSTINSDVLIPDRDNCVQCHAPIRDITGTHNVAARFDCAECHRYHGGAHAFHRTKNSAPQRNRQSMIVQDLRKLQEDSGYVTQEGLRELSESLGEPLHRLHEVASFFPHFRLTPAPKVEVLVCRDMACHLRGAKACRAALDQTAAELNSKVSTDSDRVEVRGVSCLGRCDSPVAVSINDSIFAGQSIEELRALVTKAHSGATLHAPKPDRSSRPWKIDPYTGKPEYAALRAFIDQWKAFIKEHPEARSKKPSEVLGDEQSPPARLLAELKAANLRGMGGAGFPASEKWKSVARAKVNDIDPELLARCQERGIAPPPPVKYVVCNGDESEPGTFKDRELLLRYPHLVLEGMILGGLTVGASTGYVYIRHEYHEQIDAINEAIRAARSKAFAGQTFWAVACHSTWKRCSLAPAVTSAASRTHCSRRWKTAAPSRATSRRASRSKAFAASPRCSTTSKPLPGRRRSRPTAASGTPTKAFAAGAACGWFPSAAT